jgi:hypothetical protein
LRVVLAQPESPYLLLLLLSPLRLLLLLMLLLLLPIFRVILSEVRLITQRAIFARWVDKPDESKDLHSPPPASIARTLQPTRLQPITPLHNQPKNISFKKPSKSACQAPDPLNSLIPKEIKMSLSLFPPCYPLNRANEKGSASAEPFSFCNYSLPTTH